MLGVELRPSRGAGDTPEAKLGHLAGGGDAQLAHVHQATGPHMDDRGIRRRRIVAVEIEIRPRSRRGRLAARLRRLQVHMHFAQGPSYSLVLVVFKLLTIDTIVTAFFAAVQNQHCIMQSPLVIANGCRPGGMHRKEGALLVRLRPGNSAAFPPEIDPVTRQDVLPDLARPVPRQAEEARHHCRQQEDAAQQNPSESCR